MRDAATFRLFAAAAMDYQHLQAKTGVPSAPNQGAKD
jgi:hypothetical protein